MWVEPAGVAAIAAAVAVLGGVVALGREAAAGA